MKHSPLLVALATGALLLAPGPGPALADGAGSEATRGLRSAPADYVYEREWLYSSDASEVPDAAVGPGDRVATIAALSGYGEEDSRVRIYDAGGTLLTTWDVPIANVGGIDFDRAGNLLIADYSGQIISDVNPSVQRWSPNGSLLGTFYLPTYSSAAGDVAEAPDGTIWVTDVTLDQIQRFAPDGTYLGAIASSGTAPGQLDSPWGLDVLSNGNLVVADRNNYRVQVLDPTGAPVAAWGQPGTAAGQFSSLGPGGIGVRDDDTVYVSDALSRVQAFSPSGAYLGTVSASTRSGNGMTDIQSVAFGADRAMYVAGSLAPFEKGVARYVPSTGPSTRTGIASVVRTKAPIRVRSGRFNVRVRCTEGTGPCAGSVIVKVKGRAVARPASFKTASGASSTVRLQVTATGRKVLRPGRVVRAKASIGGRTTRIKLRRARG